MQIQDLAIDNYVKCKVSNDAGIYKILAIDGYNLKVMLDGARQGEWYTLDKIKGIPHTPEILEKCGFVKNTTDDGTAYYNLKFNDEPFCDLSLLGREENGVYVVMLYPYLDEFKYHSLHQIQNIFYSITQKELIINL